MTRPLLAWLWLLAVATGSICLLSLLGVDETPETHAVVLSIPAMGLGLIDAVRSVLKTYI